MTGRGAHATYYEFDGIPGCVAPLGICWREAGHDGLHVFGPHVGPQEGPWVTRAEWDAAVVDETMLVSEDVMRAFWGRWP